MVPVRVYPMAMLPEPSMAAEPTERWTLASPPTTPSWKRVQFPVPVLRISNQRSAAWSVPSTSVTKQPTSVW